MEQLSTLAETTLGGAINTTTTTITVADHSSFPGSATYYVAITTTAPNAPIEIVNVTGGAGTNTWTVTRGVSPTTGQSWSSGAKVVGVLTEPALLAFIQQNSINAVSEDTAPTLGGNLNLGGHNVGSLTPTVIGFLDPTSSVQSQINGKQATITGGATTITSSNLATNKVLVSDGSGKVAASSVTTTTLGFVDPTSSIQTQLNAKTGPETLAQVLTNGNDASGANILGVNEVGCVAVANPAIGVNGMLIIDTQTGTELEIGCLAFARNSGVGASHVIIGGTNCQTYGLGSGSQTIDIGSIYGLASSIPFTINIGFHASGGNTATVAINGSTVTINGITYPVTDGTIGQVLKTNGSATVSFGDAASPGVLAGSWENVDAAPGGCLWTPGNNTGVIGDQTAVIISNIDNNGIDQTAMLTAIIPGSYVNVWFDNSNYATFVVDSVSIASPRSTINFASTLHGVGTLGGIFSASFAPNANGITPGGSDTQIQFNNSGSFGASANLVWDDADTRLGVGNASPEARIDNGTCLNTPGWYLYNDGSTNVDGIGLYNNGAGLGGTTDYRLFCDTSNGTTMFRFGSQTHDGATFTEYARLTSDGKISATSYICTSVLGGDPPAAGSASAGDRVMLYTDGTSTNQCGLGINTSADPYIYHFGSTGEIKLFCATSATGSGAAVYTFSPTALTAPAFIGDGSGLTGVTATATPGGSNTQVQYNSSGALGGDSGLTWDGSGLTINTAATIKLALTGGTANGLELTANGGANATTIKQESDGLHFWDEANNADRMTIANAGTITITGNVSAANLSGTNTGDQNLAPYVLASSLATVATTGAYGDLSGTPSLGTMAAQNVGATADVGVMSSDGVTPITLHFTNGIFQGAS
jgi:hypothetical protein